MMGEDETATLHCLNTCEAEIIEPTVKEHNGRIFKRMGDGFLIEFSSAVDSVDCALAWQKQIEDKNHPLKFRIGINLGDVIAQGDDVYGDGVNIAARVEKLADPGGICISRDIFNQIKKKINLGFEYLGEQQLKNILEPVRVYKLLLQPEDAGKVIGEKKTIVTKRRWLAFAGLALLVIIVGAVTLWKTTQQPEVEVANPEKMAYALPDKPSIAVLPFDNMSGDDKQDYLSDGFTEDLITSISKIPRIFVISRQSSFTYKGKPVNVKTVAEDLGVRYVLEGSIQKSGDQIRINVQMIDALTGYHQWSERYDRKIEDIFKLKDEIIFKVVTELAVELTEGERARTLAHYTDNFEAWQTVLLGSKNFVRHKKESNIRARELYIKAIRLDPRFLTAYLGLAWTHFMDVRMGWTDSREKSIYQAVESANRALAIDDTYWGAYSILCNIHLVKREFEKTDDYFKKAGRHAPATTEFYALRAFQLNYLGKPHKAVEHFQEAMRLSPFYPTWYLYHLGLAYHLTGQHEKAIETLKKAVERTPNSIFTHPRLAMIYSDLGRVQEAQAEAAEVLRINPEFTIEGWAKANPFKDPAIVEHRKELLRKAGLPE
jgi:adenylate cyclase